MRPLRGLGSIAYGVYLLHPLVFNIAAAAYRGPARSAVVIVAGVACTLVIAQLSWEWFEKPIVRLGHRVSYTTAPSKAEPNLAPAEAS